MPTITVLDSGGVVRTINTLPNLGQSNMAGSTPVVFASDQTPLSVTSTTADVQTSGSITNTQSITANTNGQYATIIKVAGTWTGTLIFEQTIDAGATWDTAYGTPIINPATGTTTQTTVNGEWCINSGAFTSVRVRGLTVTSGTATISINASAAQHIVDALVHGGSPVGVAPILPPLAVSGVDGSGFKRHIKTATDGTLQISGTVQGASAVGTAPSLPPVAISGVDASGLKQHVRIGAATRDNSLSAVVADATITRCSFADTGSGLIAPEMLQIINSGMTVAQANGNLTITTGTTINAEFLARSVVPVTGSFIRRLKFFLSQRIVNQNFCFYMADLIGSSLACTSDATGNILTITKTAHGYTANNIGQAVMVAAGSGFAADPPSRMLIASIVDANTFTVTNAYSCIWTRSTTTATVTFLGGNPIFAIGETATVSNSSDTAAIVNGAVSLLTQTSGGVTTFTCLNAGAASGTLTLGMTAKAWTASTTGTCTVFGMNSYSEVFNGTTSTQDIFDVQRRGFGSGATVATISTTNSPGPLTHVQGDNTYAALSSRVSTTSTTHSMTQASDRVENIPNDDVQLYLFIHVFNGVTAPATTTTLTVGMWSIEKVGNNKVWVAGATQTGQGQAIQTRNIDTVTVSQGTGSNLNAQVTGSAAHSAAAANNPVRIAGKAKTTIDTTLVDNDACDLFTDPNGSLLIKPYATSSLDSLIVATGGGIVPSTTATALQAAAAASTRNFYTSLQLSSDALSAATEIIFRDTALTCSSQTIASNTITTSAAHGLSIGDPLVFFATTMTGPVVGVTYYVLTVPSTTTLTFSATRGGSTFGVSGTSVTATIAHVLFRQKLQTTGVAVPTQYNFPTPLRGGVAVGQEVVFTVAATGGVFFSAQGYNGV